MSKYNLQSQPSIVAKHLLLAFLIVSVLALFSIWPINSLNVVFLIAYILAFIYLIYFSEQKKMHFQLDSSGDIDVYLPEKVCGKINARSFYNRWLMLLCIEIKREWHLDLGEKHNKQYRWFIVFSDSFKQREYRLIARLIRQECA